MKILIHLIVSAIAIGIASYIVPGVALDGFFSALLVAIVLGLINVFLKPILFLLTLPITILTLGLFSLVLNALLVLFAASLVSGFQIVGFLPALIFAVVLSIINLIFGLFGAR